MFRILIATRTESGSGGVSIHTQVVSYGSQEEAEAAISSLAQQEKGRHAGDYLSVFLYAWRLY